MVIRELKKRLEGRLREILWDKLSSTQELSEREKVFENIVLQEPKNKSFGDLSTNASMVLASYLKSDPLSIAETLKDKIFSLWEEIEDIAVEKPGFINFRLKDSFIKEKLKEVAIQKERYGFNQTGNGVKVHLEYVSSNPTGDLHIGHGRWGALGDTLANIYNANGYEVFREYYVNDYGTQIEKFADCVKSLYLSHFGIKMPYPSDGYPEETVSKVAGEIYQKYGDRFILRKDTKSPEVDVEGLGRKAVEIMLSNIKETLSLMGVTYDNWFYESSLYEGDRFERVVDELKQRGVVYEKDGAVWFKTSNFGDEKDRVVIRSEGNPTYFASDILYLMNKIARGFDLLIYILGADHHGYVKRLQAVAKSLGIDVKRLVIIIGQLVRIVKSGNVVKMSRRKGKTYTLKDLLKEVGKDPVRYFFCTASFDTPMDFDVDLAKQKSAKNPVYYVQYAHARIESVIEKAKSVIPENISTGPDIERLLRESNKDSSSWFVDLIENLSLDRVDFSRIQFKNSSERDLAKTVIFYPDVIYGSCRNNSPYQLVQYLYRLASEFHFFYNHYRILRNNRINIDRFILALLVRVVLRNALKILNLSAPERM